MPKTDLTDAEVADLVAYIESLDRMRRRLASRPGRRRGAIVGVRRRTSASWSA